MICSKYGMAMGVFEWIIKMYLLLRIVWEQIKDLRLSNKEIVTRHYPRIIWYFFLETKADAQKATAKIVSIWHFFYSGLLILKKGILFSLNMQLSTLEIALEWHGSVIYWFLCLRAVQILLTDTIPFAMMKASVTEWPRSVLVWTSFGLDQFWSGSDLVWISFGLNNSKSHYIRKFCFLSESVEF